MKISKLLFIIVFLMTTGYTFGQCDQPTSLCLTHLKNEFISDGQNYRSLLVDDEHAEFTTTFFKDVEYRIAACSGDEDGQLNFKVFDKDRTLIFSSANYNNATYWNFIAEENFDCVIEAQLEEGKMDSGCAVILIGFKQ